jgi:mono/diheme cytochrome c family protein
MVSRVVLGGSAAFIFAVLTAVAFGKSDASAAARRGKYLVEEVAMCQECHTPRDPSGALDLQRWLKGGPVFFQPAIGVPGWAERTPAIAGLTGWSDDDFLYFLENGQRRTGEIPRPPMKRYRLSHEDAVAILTYLRSLATPSAEGEHRRSDSVPPARPR